MSENVVPFPGNIAHGLVINVVAKFHYGMGPVVKVGLCFGPFDTDEESRKWIDELKEARRKHRMQDEQWLREMVGGEPQPGITASDGVAIKSIGRGNMPRHAFSPKIYRLPGDPEETARLLPSLVLEEVCNVKTIMDAFTEYSEEE